MIIFHHSLLVTRSDLKLTEVKLALRFIMWSISSGFWERQRVVFFHYDSDLSNLVGATMHANAIAEPMSGKTGDRNFVPKKSLSGASL
jgi:ABC-type uncharacterized transport system involved in gliding motility auxiliary subunit